MQVSASGGAPRSLTKIDAQRKETEHIWPSVLYVRPFPGPGGKVQISSEGGTEAVWSRNGRELFYRNRARMMAVAVTMDPTFSAAKPRVLFEGRYEMGPVYGMINYDVSRDGERFLMPKAPPSSGGASARRGPQLVQRAVAPGTGRKVVGGLTAAA